LETKEFDSEAGHTVTFDSFAMKDDVSSTPKSFRLSFDWQWKFL